MVYIVQTLPMPLNTGAIMNRQPNCEAGGTQNSSGAEMTTAISWGRCRGLVRIKKRLLPCLEYCHCGTNRTPWLCARVWVGSEPRRHVSGCLAREVREASAIPVPLEGPIPPYCSTHSPSHPAPRLPGGVAGMPVDCLLGTAHTSTSCSPAAINPLYGMFMTTSTNSTCGLSAKKASGSAPKNSLLLEFQFLPIFPTIASHTLTHNCIKIVSPNGSNLNKNRSITTRRHI